MPKYPGNFHGHPPITDEIFAILHAQGIAKGQVDPSLPLLSGLPGCPKYFRSGKNFINFDRGYFHHFLQDGSGESTHWRIVYNYMWHDHLGDFPDDRMKESKVPILDWQSGDKIAICAPDPYHCEIFGLNANRWIEKTSAEIRKYSDRPIVLNHRKVNPVREIYKDLHCVVTFHSNCWLHALMIGVPVITTCKHRKIGSIDQIENPPRDRSFIQNMFYKQWTMAQFESGQAWEEFCQLSKNSPANLIEDRCEYVYHE